MSLSYPRHLDDKTRTPTVCVIAGDDAAPEVMRPTVEVLRLLAPSIHFADALSGREALESFGDAFPGKTREAIDIAESTLFGARGGPSTAGLWYLACGKQTYRNIRPVRWDPGYRRPILHPAPIA